MRSPQRVLIAGLVMVLVMFGALLPAGATSPPVSREQQVRKLVAQHAHVPVERLRLADLVSMDFVETGVHLQVAKVVDHAVPRKMNIELCRESLRHPKACIRAGARRKGLSGR